MTSAAPPACNNASNSATTGALKFRDMILSKFVQNHANLTSNLDKNTANITSQSEPKITEENHSAQWVLLLLIYSCLLLNEKLLMFKIG
jgi:hypothetical protein